MGLLTLNGFGGEFEPQGLVLKLLDPFCTSAGDVPKPDTLLLAVGLAKVGTKCLLKLGSPPMKKKQCYNVTSYHNPQCCYIPVTAVTIYPTRIPFCNIQP